MNLNDFQMHKTWYLNSTKIYFREYHDITTVNVHKHGIFCKRYFGGSYGYHGNDHLKDSDQCTLNMTKINNH